jgi:SAM-dependent methyltransferase
MWFDELLQGAAQAQAALPAAWQERQQQSIERNEDEHYNEDPRPAQMFGNFIATTLTDRNAIVLDVGCGISPKLPHYVEQLGLTRYLGLEPLAVPVAREYACLTGAIAEEMPLKDSSIDAVIFATSFDHIADATAAIAETRRVLKPGGAVYMWQGISDADALAESSTLHRLKRGALAVPLIAAQAAVIAYRMQKRRRDLRLGNRLDSMHERWFTRHSLVGAVSGWGFDLVRYLEPPGLSSMYLEMRKPQTSDGA